MVNNHSVDASIILLPHPCIKCYIFTPFNDDELYNYLQYISHRSLATTTATSTLLTNRYISLLVPPCCLHNHLRVISTTSTSLLISYHLFYYQLSLIIYSINLYFIILTMDLAVVVRRNEELAATMLHRFTEVLGRTARGQLLQLLPHFLESFLHWVNFKLTANAAAITFSQLLE
jgi:hypothetical protein